MTTLLAITGSYREDGIIDQAVATAAAAARRAGAEVEIVHLRNYPIEFCRNCRECTQTAGEAPGQCVIKDGMATLIQKIEAADGFVLASPTNFYTVTALFKRFMERLVVYAYWPWGAAHAPQHGRHEPDRAGHRKAPLGPGLQDPGPHWRRRSRPDTPSPGALRSISINGRCSSAASDQ